MAYGCNGSLDHALPRIERASKLLEQKLAILKSEGATTSYPRRLKHRSPDRSLSQGSTDCRR